MYKNITKNAAVQLINDYLSSKVEYWERYFRVMYYYNRSTFNAAVGTASYHIEGNEDGTTAQKFQEKLIGLLPSYMATLEFNGEMIRMTYTQQYTINNVRKTYNHWLEIIMQTEGNMRVVHYNGVNAALFLLNKTLYEQNKTIEQARNMYGLPINSTSEDVITAMATQEWKLRYDPPQYAEGDVVATLAVHKQNPNTATVALSVTKQNAAIEVVRTHIEVWPTTTVLGLPPTVANSNCGAQFPWEDSFVITTELRNRAAYQMLGGAPYKIKAWATVRETDGDDYSVYTETLVDIEDINPLLDS
jgi:hypothetical protein